MLRGLRSLEIGHFSSAPFCTRFLGDRGADGIKIEPPAGAAARQWCEMVNGRSLWWSMHGRNKRSVTVDLKTEGGKELILKLVAHCDVVIENFRPRQLERMGLSPEVLRQPSPDLIIAQIRSEEHTSELQSLMRISYAVFCLKKNNTSTYTH